MRFTQYQNILNFLEKEASRSHVEGNAFAKLLRRWGGMEEFLMQQFLNASSSAKNLFRGIRQSWSMIQFFN